MSLYASNLHQGGFLRGKYDFSLLKLWAKLQGNFILDFLSSCFEVELKILQNFIRKKSEDVDVSLAAGGDDEASADGRQL